MKFLRHASAILLGLGIAAAVGSSAAWSQEQLVMPFACDAHGGGVRLYPAPQQSYRIYGTREHKLFSYCSPNTPDRCHNWMLHRFDLDCSGVRVPWISVAEAAAQRGRAWVEDGRMSLQMGAVWASPREERYPRRRWWERRHQFYDEGFDERGSFERPAGSPRDVVELPPGFAPVLGTRAQFVGVPPAEISTGPPERNSETATATPPKPPAPQKREASPAAQPKETTAQAIKPPAPTPAKRETPKAAETAASAEKSAPKAEVAAKSDATPQAKTEKATTPAPKAETATGTSIAPTIINKPQGASAQPSSAPAASPPGAGAPTAVEATSETSASATQAQGDIATSPFPTGAAEQSTQIAGNAEVNSAKAEGASPIATGSLRDQGANEGALDLLRAQTLAIGFVLFGILAATSFVLWSRRQERLQLGASVRRDIASVSFGGHAPSTKLPAPAGTQSAPAHTDGMQSAEADLAGIGLRVPSTPAEALQVLGASPDAAIDVIKKIVDGLRQSWHPDLARSDEDRNYREQRIKQINVAWDILSGRRSAA